MKSFLPMKTRNRFYLWKTNTFARFSLSTITVFILKLLFSLAKMIAFISGNHSFERVYRKHTGLLSFCDLVVVVISVIIMVAVVIIVGVLVLVVVIILNSTVGECRGGNSSSSLISYNCRHFRCLASGTLPWEHVRDPSGTCPWHDGPLQNIRPNGHDAWPSPSKHRSPHNVAPV